jgi:hypothetical protein
MLASYNTEATAALLLVSHCSEAEKLEAAEEEGRNNDVWAGMEADDPELQAALIRAGGWVGEQHPGACHVCLTRHSTIPDRCHDLPSTCGS